MPTVQDNEELAYEETPEVDLASPDEKKAMLAQLLARYEAAERLKQQLIAEHEALFEQLARLDDEQSEVKEASKRLVFSKNGPPVGDDDVRGKLWRPATGELFKMKVVYAQAQGFYDPAKLPAELLKEPGVVSEVNTAAVKRLKDPRIKRAWVAPRWKTPSLTIERNMRDSEEGTDE